MYALHKNQSEPVDGFRTGNTTTKDNFMRRTGRGAIIASNFGADLARHFRSDGIRGVTSHVKNTVLFEYQLRSRTQGVGVVEHNDQTVDLAAGMEVLGLMTGLIMLSVGLLVYSETQAAMPTPEDPALSNASEGLNDTAVSVVNLSKVAFIIGAAAIMISYLVGGLGGMGGGGGLQ
jgi:hypothetical protein